MFSERAGWHLGSGEPPHRGIPPLFTRMRDASFDAAFFSGTCIKVWMSAIGVTDGGWLVDVTTPPSAGVPERIQRYFVGETDRDRVRDLLGRRLRISPAEACTFVREVSRENAQAAGLHSGEVAPCPRLWMPRNPLGLT